MREALQELIEGRAPSGCLIVAELGVNHDGSARRAIELLHRARDVGADAVKLQLFVPHELCSRLHRAAEIAMLERLRLSDEDHVRICTEAREIDMPIVATPFDELSLELLRRLEIPMVKIGSGEVTHTPLLAKAARTRLPIILSTGGCEWIDIERAVAVLRENGCERLSLLHCVSAYPPPDEQLNLRTIAELAKRYPACPIGFSDHTLGLEAAVAAVALGAKIIEKHLTLDCAGDGPDHAASADPKSFAAMVRAVRRVEQMLGDGRKRVQPCEGVIGRSAVAARPLVDGDTLSAADIAFKRPGSGVRPWAAAGLIGRKLRCRIPADEFIHETDLE